MPPKKMALAILVSPTNSHAVSWLHPEADNSPGAQISFDQRAAELAGRGRFDLSFVADAGGAHREPARLESLPALLNMREPVTLLTVTADATKHIGLGSTASTRFFRAPQRRVAIRLARSHRRRASDVEHRHLGQ